MLVIGLAQIAYSDPVAVPAPEVLSEARGLVQNMIANVRGPYSRIRWFCNDGSVLPPEEFACRAHGGGRQHAQYSTETLRLAELGWHVGTIFATHSYSALKADGVRHARLRELALERYMKDIDDGWVLRKAKSYRGRVQLEDEVVAGRALLLGALADGAFAQDNFLLMRELTRVVPHGEETDLDRRIRRTAVELAEADRDAERWRAEIHSAPTSGTARALRTWAATRSNAQVVSIATQLAADLDSLFSSQAQRDRLTVKLAALKKAAQTAEWATTVASHLNASGEEAVTGLCADSESARRRVSTSIPVTQKLNILDAMDALESRVRTVFLELSQDKALTRGQHLRHSAAMLGCVYGAGFISARELDSARGPIPGAAQSAIEGSAYKEIVAQMQRVPGWAAGTVRFTFAEALGRYTALDSRAARFSDDLLRGSPLWSLGDLLGQLNQDVAALTGTSVDIAGERVAGAIALNPGFAQGRLRVFETLDEAESANPLRTDIVVIPETIAELKPVAGILTLGEGNALSHVQLLARNFGIPNVAIDYQTVKRLKPLEGTDVILIVSTDGNVILRPADAQTIEHLALGGSTGTVSEQKITVPKPQLSKSRVLRIDDISRALSGKVVGPKAANLGELRRLFPGRVAPAVAVPFGVYASHLDQQGLRERLRQTYRRYADGEIGLESRDEELAAIRGAIAKLKLDDATRRELTTAMQREFGEAGTYGVFVRSDTNVEDLPQFTGAGLSQTVANVVGLDVQLATVPEVWSSVLSPRAIAWRSNLLANPDEIYASVLLMKSVPSEKSGVLVTANLWAPGSNGLTVSTAWGVGGAVAGEAAETLVLTDNDAVQLITEAKTPYQRQLLPTGGVDWVSAPAGRALNESDIAQLRVLAHEVNEKYAPVFDEQGKQRPWDIEFGFLEGQLTLFQIRPLVEKNARRTDQLMTRLRPTSITTLRDSVSLEKPLAGAQP